MTRRERFDRVMERFRQAMPDPKTELNYSNPFELLCAVILSAQCTDKRVNLITPGLFRAFPTPQALAAASVEEIFECIRSCSYPNNKARLLQGMARTLGSDSRESMLRGTSPPKSLTKVRAMPCSRRALLLG